MPPRRKVAEIGTVIGYTRVSTEEQAKSGLGLAAQEEKLADECERRGYRLIEVLCDPGLSAKEMRKREALNTALERIETGEAQILMVSKLDRLSRSVHDWTGLLGRAQRKGWTVVCLDIGIDTNTPTGEAMANIMASFAQLERRLIGQRTSDALQVLKRQGVQLGRPDRAPLELVERIADLRSDGKSLQFIADILTGEWVPTSQGGKRWYASTVAAVLARPEAQR